MQFKYREKQSTPRDKDGEEVHTLAALIMDTKDSSNIPFLIYREYASYLFCSSNPTCPKYLGEIKYNLDGER